MWATQSTRQPIPSLDLNRVDAYQIFPVRGTLHHETHKTNQHTNITDWTRRQNQIVAARSIGKRFDSTLRQRHLVQRFHLRPKVQSDNTRKKSARIAVKLKSNRAPIESLSIRFAPKNRRRRLESTPARLVATFPREHGAIWA
jgi:hypothetical protein